MTISGNPWLGLAQLTSRYALASDEEFIRRHNSGARPKYQIQTNSLPEPFIGDPKSAKLILLNLNPGHDGTVEADHGRPEIKEAIFRNLRQEVCEYPFYAFNPAFGESKTFKQTGVATYWRAHTRRLQETTGLEDKVFAKKLFVIEWFPYPSENWFYTAKRFAATREPLCPPRNTASIWRCHFLTILA